MALVLVVEDGTGLASANVWNSLSDAIAYFEGDLGGFAWDDSDVAASSQALVAANRRISRGLDWSYPKYRDTQSLPFPAVINGVISTPAVIKEAELELARWIRQRVATSESVLLDEASVTSLSVPGAISLGLEGGQNASIEIPNFILQMVRPFGGVPSRPESRHAVKRVRVASGY